MVVDPDSPDDEFAGEEDEEHAASLRFGRSSEPPSSGGAKGPTSDFGIARFMRAMMGWNPPQEAERISPPHGEGKNAPAPAMIVGAGTSAGSVPTSAEASSPPPPEPHPRRLTPASSAPSSAHKRIRIVPPTDLPQPHVPLIPTGPLICPATTVPLSVVFARLRRSAAVAEDAGSVGEGEGEGEQESAISDLMPPHFEHWSAEALSLISAPADASAVTSSSSSLSDPYPNFGSLREAGVPWRKTHANHPTSKWVRTAPANYDFT